VDNDNGLAGLSHGEIVEMFAAIVESLEGAAGEMGVPPAEIQSTIWNQAVHG